MGVDDFPCGLVAFECDELVEELAGEDQRVVLAALIRGEHDAVPRAAPLLHERVDDRAVDAGLIAEEDHHCLGARVDGAEARPVRRRAALAELRVLDDGGAREIDARADFVVGAADHHDHLVERGGGARLGVTWPSSVVPPKGRSCLG